MKDDRLAADIYPVVSEEVAAPRVSNAKEKRGGIEGSSAFAGGRSERTRHGRGRAEVFLILARFARRGMGL